MAQSLELKSALSQSHVFMKDEELVKQKISQLIADGPHTLQIISDFDKTITKYSHLGKKIPSSHHIVESHPLMPEEIRSELVQMHQKYYSIELDQGLTKDEKIPHMIDWAQNGADLFIKAKVKRSNLPKMVADSHVYVRDGFNDLVTKLRGSGVPFLIFSAGVGDVIEEVLRQQDQICDGVKLVANYMKFDGEEHFSGYQGNLIHTCNKNGSVLKNDQEWTNATQNRSSVILLGDMVGDVTMADGVLDQKTCLKIGFLNSRYEELLNSYLDHFDIVLENDQTMDVVNAVVDEILKS